MKVWEVMIRAVKTCSAGDSLDTAAQIMRVYDCGCVPVVDRDRQVVGIITDRDICMAANLRGRALKDSPVGSAMTKEVFTCEADQEISAVERIMRDRQVRRLPVVYAGNRLVGIVTLDDLAREARRESMRSSMRQVTDAEIASVFGAVCRPRPATEAAPAP